MATISDIEGAVLDQLDENRANPLFWNIQFEIRPLIVEGLCEATLLSGEPEVRSGQPFDMAAATTIFALPPGNLALVRLDTPGGVTVRKTSVFDLDMDNKAWQNDPPAATPQHWFPFGLGQFGIHPQLTADIQVFLTTLQFPVTTDPPYTGAEPFPFQIEYEEAIQKYAAHAARLKEGGLEFDSSMQLYEEFLATMEELSKFALRKGELRFSRILGAPAVVTDVEKK